MVDEFPRLRAFLRCIGQLTPLTAKPWLKDGNPFLFYEYFNPPRPARARVRLAPTTRSTPPLLMQPIRPSILGTLVLTVKLLSAVGPILNLCRRNHNRRTPQPRCGARNKHRRDTVRA